MKKSSSKDFSEAHPYIKEAINKFGVTRDNWLTSIIKRTKDKVIVKIITKQV